MTQKTKNTNFLHVGIDGCRNYAIESVEIVNHNINDYHQNYQLRNLAMSLYAEMLVEGAADGETKEESVEIVESLVEFGSHQHNEDFGIIGMTTGEESSYFLIREGSVFYDLTLEYWENGDSPIHEEKFHDEMLQLWDEIVDTDGTITADIAVENFKTKWEV